MPDPALPALPIVTSTVNVPAGSNLNAVQWKSKVRYKLAPGTMTAAGTGINLPNDVWIDAAKDAAGLPATQVSFQPTATWAHLFNVPISGQRVAIENLILKCGRIVVFSPEGQDITLRNMTLYEGQLWLSRNVRRLLVSKVVAPNVLPDYFGYTDARGIGNEDVTVDRCKVAGSMNAHDLRFYGLRRALVKDSSLLNPSSIGGLKGQSIKLCDGSDCEIRNCDLHTAQFGPNPQYEPFPVLVDRLKLINCRFHDRVAFNAGCTNVTWLGGSVTARSSGSCAWVKAYTGRPTPTGTMDNVVGTYVGTGKLWFDGWSGNIKYRGRGNVFNGKVQ